MDLLSQIRNLTLGLAVGVILPMTVYWGVKVAIVEKPYAEVLPEKAGREEAMEYDRLKREYHAAQRGRFDRMYFYAAAAIGIVAILAGGLIKVPFLGIGLILGGTVCLSHGYWIYWFQLDVLVKFLSLLLALIIIIALGYRIAAREKRR